MNSILILGMLMMVFQAILGIDNNHFYRPPFFWGEAQVDLDWFCSADLTVGNGSTHYSFDRDHQRVPLLDIYGPQNIQFLAQNVTFIQPNAASDLLIALSELPTNGTFGFLSYNARFAINEVIFNGYQHLKHGFFIQAYLPWRSLKINNITSIDLSPGQGFPNKNTPLWQEFITHQQQIFNQLGITIANNNHQGIGDFSLLLGWAHTTYCTEILDFIDVNAKWGILFPTSSTVAFNHPFELPTGYNGFWGSPLKFDLATGICNWITFGVHLGALFLFERTRTLPLHTSLNQQGLITFGHAALSLNPGTYWDISAYLKADHFFRGLSWIIGYDYTMKDHDGSEWSSYNSAVLQDSRYRGWNMHALRFMIEYNYSQEPEDIGPRITFSYSRVLAGSRIFDTDVLSGSLGFDIEWCF